MGEKKEIKVKLSTVILLFIIFILVIALGITYYLGFVKNKNENVEPNIGTKNTVESNKNNNQTAKQEINEESNYMTGTYTIQPDREILEEGYFEMADIGDESIEFKEDGSFYAYLGWGQSISGSYEKQDNVLNCTANKFYAEALPDQQISATISFKILDKDKIEITKTSEKFKAKIGDLVHNTLTDEDKDMQLYPFVKGIKFIKNKENGDNNNSLVSSINGKTYSYTNSYKDKYTIAFSNNQFTAKFDDMTVTGNYEDIGLNHIRCNFKNYTSISNDGKYQGGMNLESKGWYIEFEIAGNNLIVSRKCQIDEGESEIQIAIFDAFGENQEYRGN